MSSTFDKDEGYQVYNLLDTQYKTGFTCIIQSITINVSIIKILNKYSHIKIYIQDNQNLEKSYEQITIECMKNNNITQILKYLLPLKFNQEITIYECYYQETKFKITIQRELYKIENFFILHYNHIGIIFKNEYPALSNLLFQFIIFLKEKFFEYKKFKNILINLLTLCEIINKLENEYLIFGCHQDMLKWIKSKNICQTTGHILKALLFVFKKINYYSNDLEKTFYAICYHSYTLNKYKQYIKSYNCKKDLLYYRE